MKVDTITPLHFINNANALEPTQQTQHSFTHWLTEQMDKSNEQLQQADQALLSLASGQTTSLHHTMIVLEEAKLSFQYLQQIRNTLLSAYHELLREPL
jgi:flagellar hook-basal body complex protein FliE